MLFDYETLTLLRNNTRLDPISAIKVSDARARAVDYQQFFNRIHKTQYGVDYGPAEQLEAELRFKVWKDIIFDYWSKHANGRDIDEYALNLLSRLKGDEKKPFMKRRNTRY